MATPAFAQVEDEIIVTATKRQTTLQDTPVAVTVTTAEVIEKARIIDLKDLQSVVPTLRVSQLQNAANTSLSIRGFANGANNIGIEPSVGLFIDGVYRSRAAAQIGDLPKLDRIEVLSGPQSTLFGKNASAGVVSIATAKPSYETQGFVEGGYGNYNLFTGKAYFTTGLSDTAAFSLGGGFQKRDGYGEVVSLNEDINNLNRFNVRGQLLLEPSDNMSWRLIADYSKIDEECCIVAASIVGPTAQVIGLLGGAVSDANDAFTYETPLNRNTPNKFDDWGVSAQGDYDMGFAELTSISSYRSNQGGFSGSDSDFSTITLLENVYQDVEISTLTQELRLTSNPSDSRLDWMVGGYFFKEDIEQKSGASYGAAARPYVGALLNQLSGGTVTFDILEATIPNLAPGASYANGQGSDEVFEQDNTAFSLFGTVDYSLTEKLTLTGGLNYTKDKKTVQGSTVNNDAFAALNFAGADGAAFLGAGVFANGQAPIPGLLPNGIPSFMAAFGLAPTAANIGLIASGGAGAAAQAAFGQYNAGVQQFAAGAAAGGALSTLASVQFFNPFLNFPNAVEDGKSSDDDLTWTVKAAYEVNDNVNLFASAATGFKSTSWNLTRNARPFLASRGAIDSAGLTLSNPNFGTRFAGPEETTVFELGMKTRFERGAFNITVFDQTIKGFQSTTFAGTAFVLNNAGEQSVRGAEFDGVFSPTDNLKFNLGGAYLDAKFDEFVGAEGPNGPTDLSGERPAGIPKWALSAAATYDFSLSSTIDGYLRGDYQYESSTPTNDNLPVNITRTVGTLNGALGLDFNNGVALQLWVRNLNNDEYFTSGFPSPAQAGTFNNYPNQPRTYGANLRYTF